MTRFLFGAGLVGACLFAVGAPATAAIKIVHPWIAAPPLGAITASGFVRLKNPGAAPEVFLGGSTPAARALQIHAMSMTGGVMRMRRMDGGLALGANATVDLSPDGGYHLMFVGLKHALKAGDHIPVALDFAKGGQIKTVFIVEGPMSSKRPAD